MTLLEFATGWLEVVTFWIVQPFLILLLGIFLGKVLEQIIVFIGAEVSPNNRVYPFVAYIASWAVYLTTVALALHSIHILLLVLIVLGAIISLVVLVHVALALFEFVRNVLSAGAVRARWKSGMAVQSRTVHGTVAAIGPAWTRIATTTGDVLMIPNRTMKTMKPVKA